MPKKLGKPREPSRYAQILADIFKAHYRKDGQGFVFERKELDVAAERLGIEGVANLGDNIYSFKYRAQLPESIRNSAPEGKVWVLRGAGRSRYRFDLMRDPIVIPTEGKVVTNIPDATPGIVAKYLRQDEQSLLAKIRYNRLIDVFTGLTCYSLQYHLRAHVPGIGQVETDEAYVALNKQGAHFILPVQGKGKKDKLSCVQIEQDFALCEIAFPTMNAIPIAAQFQDDLIVLFDFELQDGLAKIRSEKHYRLVPQESLTAEELEAYKNRLEGD